MLFLNHVTQAHISKLIFFKKNLYLTDLIPEVQRWLKNLSKHHQQIKWKKKKKNTKLYDHLKTHPKCVSGKISELFLIL